MPISSADLKSNADSLPTTHLEHSQLKTGLRRVYHIKETIKQRSHGLVLPTMNVIADQTLDVEGPMGMNSDNQNTLWPE